MYRGERDDPTEIVTAVIFSSECTLERDATPSFISFLARRSLYYTSMLSSPKYLRVLTYIKFSQIENRELKRKRSQNESISPAKERLLLDTSRPPDEDTICENTTFGIDERKFRFIDYWRKGRYWPREYFELDDSEPEAIMNRIYARLKTRSFSRKRSEVGGSASSSGTPNDQISREGKSTPYRNPNYPFVLEDKNSFMRESECDITDASKDLCRTLLETDQIIPKDSLFNDETFTKACQKLEYRNETRVIQDIGRLIVPSAETLATYGATHLDCLIEGVNQGWTSSMPIPNCGPRPQPDYSVGFGPSAFTDDQLKTLIPFVGDALDAYTTLFTGFHNMYFPFLTSEVKCSNATIDIADRQNAHSMTIAVRGTVELFRAVKRETELHREILAFSISHDHEIVKIYGHYPVIDGQETRFYRHPIHVFSFKVLGGRDRWTAYKFTMNVYNIWMPMHLKRIRSAIDDIPSNLDFDVSEPSGSWAS